MQKKGQKSQKNGVVFCRRLYELRWRRRGDSRLIMTKNMMMASQYQVCEGSHRMRKVGRIGLLDAAMIVRVEAF